MSWLDTASKAASHLFRIGQKDNLATVAFEEGVPQRDQWYRLITAAGQTIGYTYVCVCSSEYKIPGGIFAWEQKHHCGCGREFCLKAWLERNVQQAREADAYVAAGLPRRPSYADLEMAKLNGAIAKVKVKAGAFAKAELETAERSLPFRHANPLMAHSISGSPGPRLVDTDDPKYGASDGVVKYSGTNPGDEDDPFRGGLGFADPHSQSFRRR